MKPSVLPQITTVPFSPRRRMVLLAPPQSKVEIRAGQEVAPFRLLREVEKLLTVRCFSPDPITQSGPLPNQTLMRDVDFPIVSPSAIGRGE